MKDDTGRNPQEVIRAAGSQSLQSLKEIIQTEGWTARELDDLAYQTGRSPLQQAAWKGRIDSLEYLLDDIGCDINVYSKKRFSYGKTAIFFALTQSRRDVVEYLLQRKDIKVAIVNNKGQSVLSLAASHEMPENVLKRIQQLEESDNEWWNFRETNSDGFEYGDLDPRFFNDRQLRESDVVTVFAVNPTTKKTRKGGFERRNPEAAKEWQRHKQQQNQSKRNDRKKKLQPNELTSEDQSTLKIAWNVLENHKTNTTEECQMAFYTILKIQDKLRKAWIPETVERLVEMNLQAAPCMKEVSTIPSSIKDNYGENGENNKNLSDARYKSLVEKVLSKIQKETATTEVLISSPSRTNQREKRKQDKNKTIHYSTGTLKGFGNMLEGLCITSFEPKRDGQNNLCLPQSPIWIEQIESLNSLFQELQQKCSKTGLLLAIDTEWYDQTKNQNHSELSTLQLAYYNKSTLSVSSFVIDLLVDNFEYQTLLQELICWILKREYSNDDALLGFSMGHDLTMLCKFVHQDSHSSIRMVDLQHLLSDKTQRGNLPGLKTCTAKYSKFPLSKKEQCSDWSIRPLSQAQLAYAGLDAAILLILLAEFIREMN